MKKRDEREPWRGEALDALVSLCASPLLFPEPPAWLTDRPATEITPEMIEAGADVVWRYFNDVLPDPTFGRETAIAVFEAMERLHFQAR